MSNFFLVITGINNYLDRMMQTDDVLTWVCQYCGEENQLWIDLTVSSDQDFIEDCEVCCRPNRILVKHDKEDEEYIFVESRMADE
jgi:hypothetical protein